MRFVAAKSSAEGGIAGHSCRPAKPHRTGKAAAGGSVGRMDDPSDWVHSTHVRRLGLSILNCLCWP